MTEPLIIVGSRLQALIFAVGAVVIPVGLWDEVGPTTLVAALPLAFAAALTLHRRVELHDDRVLVRHQFRSPSTMRRNEITASAGHRYLRIEGPEVQLRIEVPVEIRPEVRAWTNQD